MAARRGYLQIGDVSMPYHVLNNIGRGFDHDFVIDGDIINRGSRYSQTGHAIDHLMSIQSEIYQNPVVSGVVPDKEMLRLLADHWLKLTSDPWDHVFGLLAPSDMARGPHPRLSIDYYRSVQQIYTGAGQAIIERSSSLNVLQLCPCGEEISTSDLILPTWVPNWKKVDTKGVR